MEGPFGRFGSGESEERLKLPRLSLSGNTSIVDPGGASIVDLGDDGGIVVDQLR